MERDRDPDDRAPLFGRWRYWYMLVVGFLLVCIAVFYFLTKHFS
jgi:hypothetical protein